MGEGGAGGGGQRWEDTARRGRWHRAVVEKKDSSSKKGRWWEKGGCATTRSQVFSAARAPPTCVGRPCLLKPEGLVENAPFSTFKKVENRRTGSAVSCDVTRVGRPLPCCTYGRGNPACGTRVCPTWGHRRLLPVSVLAAALQRVGAERGGAPRGGGAGEAERTRRAGRAWGEGTKPCSKNQKEETHHAPHRSLTGMPWRRGGAYAWAWATAYVLYVLYEHALDAYARSPHGPR